MEHRRYVPEHMASIKVIGVGGGGCNAINRMLGSGITGADFIAINTDVQALKACNSDNTLQIGQNLTRGLGAGADPEIGRQAADESKDDITMLVEGTDLVFIAAGMGGGTGTGAAPIIADLSKAAGSLTVGVVTKPFSWEGRRRAQIAERGIAELEQKVDTLIVIPNDKLLMVSEKSTPIIEAFSYADDVLRQGIAGITDLITQPGLINLDFADVRRIMTDAGSALMGIGTAQGENRASDAARKAVSNPLLEATIDGARGVIFNIYGGPDLSMYEVNEAAEQISKAADPDAEVIFGATITDALPNNSVRVTVLATGFGTRARERSRVFGVGDIEKVKPVNMDEIEVPAFLRYNK